MAAAKSRPRPADEDVELVPRYKQAQWRGKKVGPGKIVKQKGGPNRLTTKEKPRGKKPMKKPKGAAIVAPPHYGLRWFTPMCEFPLCGHATLASAHVLFNTSFPNAEVIRFETMSGTLTARKVPEGGLELDFPADASVADSSHRTDELRAKLMQAIGTLGIDGIENKVRGWAKGGIAWIIELDKDVPLASLALDVKGFKELEGYIIFTQPSSDPAYDIMSRVLDPVESIQEDPVVNG
ncbi:hypothetical protein RQP46_007085 [Phenoliferia psychrophenolica]